MDSARSSSTLPPAVTISNFDDSESSSSSETLETQKLLRRIPSEMFLVSLLEELCACYAKDHVQQRNLFKMLSGYLSKAKMIPVTATQDEFQQVRTNYRLAIKKFLNTALMAAQADPQERYLSLPSAAIGEQIRKAILVNSNPVLYPFTLNSNIQPQMPPVISRYKKDFVELERIGKGGFGSVYKVRSILDNQQYAIKKIKLKGTDKEFYEKVIREVKLLAGMQHQNIVRYNTAWIDHQPSRTSPQSNLPALEYPVNVVFNRQESSSSDDIDSEIARPVETSSCIIKDVTDEPIEEDCELHCDPNVEEIDEGDVEITFGESTVVNGYFDNASYLESRTTTSSKRSTSTVTETFHSTEEFSIDFDADYAGEEIHSYREVSTEVTTTSVTTNKVSPIMNLHGDFGSINGLQSESENISVRGKSRSVRFESHSNPNDLRNDDFGLKTLCNSISSTACMGCRREEQEGLCQGHSCTAEFEKSKVILYIQMELCNRTLGDWLQERNEQEPIPGCDVFSIVDESVNQSVFKQMVEGISYIHQKNLLHRDLTPKNIFLAGTEKEFHVCIGDFGLARELKDNKPKDPVTPLPTLNQQLREVVIPASNLTTDIGTCTYASPEQLKCSAYDHKSDMYSLGVIFFELYHPFKSQMEKSKCLKALREERIIAEEIKTKWPDEFSIINQLTSDDQDERPSAKELKESKLFMSNDELIKCLKVELKEKDSVIKTLRLELKMKTQLS